MTKTELIKCITNSNPKVNKKLAIQIIDSAFTAIKENIKKAKKFSYPGFGTFMIKERKKRMGRNPRTGVKMEIKASRTIGFRLSKSFKEQLQDK